MSLNPPQQEAVDYGEGALLILAGAGSGKTRVLVHRIARLVKEQLAQPYEILAVTFTNKAAAELTTRCAAMVGQAVEQMWVGTFHGIGARILRRHAGEIGYRPGFAIFDANDQLQLIKALLHEANLDEALLPPEGVRAQIDAWKNRAEGPLRVSATGFDRVRKKAAELYPHYQQRLRSSNAMDFGDLILNTIELLQGAPRILSQYQQRFRHVLVDEYQDTNPAQYKVVSMLAAGHGNLCVVGDDDQSIYGWRGADLRNILEFDRDFPGARVVHLDQNYRSTANIIKAAGALIHHNYRRKNKRLWTAQAAGAPVRIYTAQDEKDEARYIASCLYDLGPQRSRAAVFYRTNAQSRAIEEELVRTGIPYVIVGSTRFYERREIKDLIAYLRFLANPRDDISLARIINVPPRGIGRVTCERLRCCAREREVAVWDLLKAGKRAYADSLGSASRTRVGRFRNMVQGWLDSPCEEAVTALLERIIEETGYLHYLATLPQDQTQTRSENVRELLTVSRNFEDDRCARQRDPEDPELGALSAFLERLALASAIDSYEDSTAAVTLMTVHNSKGLEFPHVFLAGMEEGIFPHARAHNDELDPEAGVEEERRLCYVGMTRARLDLTLTHTRQRRLFGANRRNPPSRFLSEIPEALIVHEQSCKQPPSHLTSRRSGTRASQLATEQNANAKLNQAGHGRYRVGMKVVHPSFGLGTVRKTQGSGAGEKIVVQFQQMGIKKLAVVHARLQIL